MKLSLNKLYTKIRHGYHNIRCVLRDKEEQKRGKRKTNNEMKLKTKKKEDMK